MADETQTLADVTVVLLTGVAQTMHLEAWASAVEDDGALAGASLIAWREQSVDAPAASDDGPPDVPSLPLGSDPENPTAEAMAELLAQVTTPYFTVVSVAPPRRARMRELRKRLLAGLDLVSTSGVQDETPLLLHIGRYSRVLLAAYLNHVLQPGHSRSAVTTDYLGYLALQSASATVEAIDPEDSSMAVFARLNFGPLDLGAPPPWTFVVSLVGPDDAGLRSTPDVLSHRVSMYGTVRWEYLNLNLPLATASSGEYRMVVGLHSTSPVFGQNRDIRPNVGALLNARTVELDLGQPHSGTTLRYLVHTTAHVKATRVTVAKGGGRRAARTWSRILLRKDLSFVLKRGGPRQMRLMRLTRVVTAPLYAHRRPWLVGERDETAQDNGFHLFRHLRTERPDINAYYVMDTSSPQYDRVKDLGHVVAHSSLRHRLLMLHATVVANAYSINYVIPHQWDRTQYARHLAWRIGALRIYLKHGVHLSPNSMKRGTTGYDMLLTVTPRETATLAEAAGYQRQVAEVGLPRYDALVPTPPTRTVLFMATWRRYLVPKVFGGENKDLSPFEGSTYERFMVDFLGSPRLQQIMEKHDYRFVFLPHHNIADRVQHFGVAGNRVSIADADATRFQELLRECDAFITDHSSVGFDLAYLGTPMIYSRFDRDEFERRHAAPSWFDYERDGFGPVTYTLDETLDELDRLLDRDCVPDDVYVRRIEETFTHRDRQNCLRVTNAIEARLETG